MPIRVLVVDDHASMRQLFEVCLSFEEDLELVGAARDGLEAVDLAVQLRPDAIVLDCALPLLDGIEALPALLQAVPDAAVVMFSASGDATRSASAMRRGARTYLVKDRDGVGEVIAALRSHASEHALPHHAA